MSTSYHDPVCGKSLEAGTEATSIRYAGTAYHFCSAECARKFARYPERYVSSIDGLKPTGRVPIQQATREHMPHADTQRRKAAHDE